MTTHPPLNPSLRSAFWPLRMPAWLLFLFVMRVPLGLLVTVPVLPPMRIPFPNIPENIATWLKGTSLLMQLLGLWFYFACLDSIGHITQFHPTFRAVRCSTSSADFVTGSSQRMRDFRLRLAFERWSIGFFVALLGMFMIFGGSAYAQRVQGVQKMRGLFAVEKSLNFISDGYDSFVGDLKILRINKRLNRLAYKREAFYLIREGDFGMVDLLRQQSIPFRLSEEILRDIMNSNKAREASFVNKNFENPKFEYLIVEMEIEYVELDVQHLPRIAVFGRSGKMRLVEGGAVRDYYILDLKVL